MYAHGAAGFSTERRRLVVTRCNIIPLRNAHDARARPRATSNAHPRARVVARASEIDKRTRFPSPFIGTNSTPPRVRPRPAMRPVGRHWLFRFRDRVRMFGPPALHLFPVDEPKNCATRIRFSARSRSPHRVRRPCPETIGRTPSVTSLKLVDRIQRNGLSRVYHLSSHNAVTRRACGRRVFTHDRTCNSRHFETLNSALGERVLTVCLRSDIVSASRVEHRFWTVIPNIMYILIRRRYGLIRFTVRIKTSFRMRRRITKSVINTQRKWIFYRPRHTVHVW